MLYSRAKESNTSMGGNKISDRNKNLCKRKGTEKNEWYKLKRIKKKIL